MTMFQHLATEFCRRAEHQGMSCVAMLVCTRGYKELQDVARKAVEPPQ